MINPCLVLFGVVRLGCGCVTFLVLLCLILSCPSKFVVIRHNILSPMTEEFRRSMGNPNKCYSAHKWDNIGWDIGEVKSVQKTGQNKGAFTVYYKTEKTTYYHFLLSEDYGIDKSWVALIQK